MVRFVFSSNPEYLATADILIGDMSDINYEFLLFDRPIVLLANEWLLNNFPDIGIKTSLFSLGEALRRSIENPSEYSESRRHWLKKVIHNPDGNSSNRVVDTIMDFFKKTNPNFLLLHGGDSVLKSHLDPLYEVLLKRNLPTIYTDYFDDQYSKGLETISISPNNWLLRNIKHGFRVHIDHGVKGVGVTDFEAQKQQYKHNGFFPRTDLHITEGEISFEKTRKLLGPFSNRTVMVGYPKSDTLMKFNNERNKIEIKKKLGFDPNKPIVMYAPAGPYSYPFKQGGSLNYKTLRAINKLSQTGHYGVLVKLKNKKHHPLLLPLKRLKSFLNEKINR